MSHSSPTRPGSRSAAAVLVLLALVGTSACGSKDPVTAAPAPTPTTAAPTLAVSETPTPTPSSTPSPAPTKATTSPTPADDSTDQVGNGDADEQHQPATAGGGVCGRLEASAVARAIGSKVTGAAVPGGGCQFTGSGAKAPSVTVIDKKFVASQGMRAAKEEATSGVEGTPEDLTGIGTAAFVVTGTMFGGPSVQGAGAVHAGPRLVSINVNQEAGKSAAQVRAMTVAVLRLIADELT